jgi:hypothetical protein
VSVQYGTFFEVILSCAYIGVTPKLRLLRANLEQFVSAYSGYTCSKYLYYSSKLNNSSFFSSSANILSDVASTCVKDANLTCDGDASSRFRLGEDLVFSVGQDGVSINGTTYGWNVEYPAEQDDTVAWQVEGEYPLSTGTAEFTLKRLDSCQPGVCDCDLDLTGRTVVFEGQTFTYGSLQQFISDDGLTIWEEGPSAGRFTREDRRECDPTVSMRIRTAEVFCSTFDGVPRWFVYLDSECYERENGGCAPTVTASKITLYNGAFSCDSDGYPLGAAHSFTDDTDPPDLDGENITGTPSTNCDVENPIPSISFS